jgi:hypothetical protein
MNPESVFPFLLILLPFALAFVAEGLVIYFYKIRGFGVSLGSAIIINLLTLLLLYGSSLLLGKLGYEFNGLRLSLPVILFFWWLSVVVDGALLKLFFRNVDGKQVYLASIVMNILSYLVLYFFITNSH